jgi:hypothetical protein
METRKKRRGEVVRCGGKGRARKMNSERVEEEEE